MGMPMRVEIKPAVSPADIETECRVEAFGFAQIGHGEDEAVQRVHTRHSRPAQGGTRLKCCHCSSSQTATPLRPVARPHLFPSLRCRWAILLPRILGIPNA